MSAIAAPPIEPSAVALRRATRAGVTQAGGEVVALRCGRAVVFVALDRDRRPDPVVDHPGDDDDPVSAVDPRLDSVTDVDRGGGFRRPAVHAHVARSAHVGRFGPGLAQPDGPEPSVDAGPWPDVSHGSRPSL